MKEIITKDKFLDATQHELSSRKNKLRLDSAIEKLTNKFSFKKSLVKRL